MTEGSTRPPELLTEADLIAEMDAKKIGTDATIASHIADTMIFTEKNESGRFTPTPLGMALVKGTNEMGHRLSKPHLRATMERCDASSSW